jgi:hypothetical protein
MMHDLARSARCVTLRARDDARRPPAAGRCVLGALTLGPVRARHARRPTAMETTS